MTKGAAAGWAVLWLSAVLGVGGCGRGPQGEEVVVYCGVDEPYASKVFAEFEKETGVRVAVGGLFGGRGGGGGGGVGGGRRGRKWWCTAGWTSPTRARCLRSSRRRRGCGWRCNTTSSRASRWGWRGNWRRSASTRGRT